MSTEYVYLVIMSIIFTKNVHIVFVDTVDSFVMNIKLNSRTFSTMSIFEVKIINVEPWQKKNLNGGEGGCEYYSSLVFSFIRRENVWIVDIVIVWHVISCTYMLCS